MVLRKLNLTGILEGVLRSSAFTANLHREMVFSASAMRPLRGQRKTDSNSIGTELKGLELAVYE